METQGEGRERRILFTTNVDDVVLADAAHPITVEDRDGEPRPYVEVRRGLRALIARSVFYRLVDLAGRGRRGCAARLEQRYEVRPRTELVERNVCDAL